MRRIAQGYRWPARAKLLGWMKAAVTADDFRRRQVILLAAENMSYRQISGIVGVSMQSVKLWTGQYCRRGPEGLKRKGRGGRRSSLLTLEQERAVIDAYRNMAHDQGSLRAQLICNLIRERYRKKVGRWYAYKLLERHGFRKRRTVAD